MLNRKKTHILKYDTIQWIIPFHSYCLLNYLFLHTGLTLMEATKELHYQNILTGSVINSSRPESPAIKIACVCHQCA